MPNYLTLSSNQPYNPSNHSHMTYKTWPRHHHYSKLNWPQTCLNDQEFQAYAYIGLKTLYLKPLTYWLQNLSPHIIYNLSKAFKPPLPTKSNQNSDWPPLCPNFLDSHFSSHMLQYLSRPAFDPSNLPYIIYMNCPNSPDHQIPREPHSPFTKSPFDL